MDFFAPLVQSDELEWIRNDIILDRDSLYFDFSASGLESRVVANRMQSILGRYANTHSANSRNANFISELYKSAKIRLKELLGLGEDFFIIPSGYGASGAMKKYQEIKGLYLSPKLRAILGESLNCAPKKRVLVGGYEHHSNDISLREAFCEVVRIPLENGLMSIDSIESLLDSGQIDFASINIASNVSGIIAPYTQISNALRAKNIDIAFDLAALSPHSNVDCSLFDSAFLSPHKLIGGIGSCGILCIRSLESSLPPTFSGGGSVKYVSANSHYYIDDIEEREDSGTPPILPLLKAVLAYQYRNEMGLDFIKKREKVLYNLLLNELKQITGITLYGVDLGAEYIPILSFNIEGISPYDLSWELSHNYGIETRAGCSCAGVYGHYLMGAEEIKNIALLDSGEAMKPAWLRVSLHYSHNMNDIEIFINALKKIIKRRI
ncbi:aminotransferase class V-fold PLP-dependent enzyme [Helicobacter sp. 23-1045]